MKSKIFKKPDPEFEEIDDIDVEDSGPSIAASKKNKITIIAASSLLVTIVIYFLFFKDEKKKSEKLEEIPIAKIAAPAAADSDKSSPFAFDNLFATSKDDSDLLTNQPSTPEIPTLPELPESNLPQEKISLAPAQAEQNQQQAASSTIAIPSPNQPQQNQQQLQIQNPQDFVAEDPRYSPIIVFSGTAVGNPTRGVGYENNIVNLNQDPIGQLAQTSPSVTATYITDRVHTIAQGKLLTAVLETAINTEIPGFVRAIISRDVYGESGRDTLIPRGSRLFGSYSSQITRGQARVQISWTRLIRPDGVDLSIAFNASDQFGRSGISGDVDNKYNELITSSLLTSILTVGSVAGVSNLLNSDSSTTTQTSTTGVTTTGNATNQAIMDVGKTVTNAVGQILNNVVNTTPVIRVPQGTKITVIVNSDISIPSMR